MKTICALLTALFISVLSFGQVAKTKNLNSKPDPDKKLYTIEASCGECNFGMEGDDCDLAVKIDGKSYYVDGLPITHYGHPHAKGGFCVAVRTAEVQGDIVDGRFKVSYFKLLDDKK